MLPSTKSTIAEIVRDNYLTAEIFKQHKIDFCCNGHRTVEVACTEQKVDSNKLLEEINEIYLSQEKTITDFKTWPIHQLADYIQFKHHKYVEEKTPIIKEYLEKIHAVHGKEHPELIEVKQLFRLAADELVVHMKKEEMILFPYIKRISDSILENKVLLSASFGSVQNPIEMMKHEHSDEGDYFRKISLLTNTYTPPIDACNTYRVTLSTLAAFEEDLHLHIHLENNILFPKAIEQELLAQNIN